MRNWLNTAVRYLSFSRPSEERQNAESPSQKWGRNEMQKQSRKRLGAAAVALAGLIWTIAPAAAQGFTDWGWPQPYEKVLRQIGRLAEAERLVASRFRLAGAVFRPKHHQCGHGQGRGSGSAALRANSRSSPLVPTSTKRSRPARIQVGNGGNFPFTSLLDRACR